MTEHAAAQGRLPRALGGARRRMMAQLVLVGVGQAICVVAFALLLHVVADHVRHPDRTHAGHTGIYGPFEQWSNPVLFAGFVLTAVATIALRALGPPLAERLAQSYIHSVRLRLFDQIAESVSWGPDRRNVGVTVLRFTGDSSALRDWVSKGVASLLVDGVFVLVTVGVLIALSPLAGVMAAALVSLGAILVTVIGHQLELRVRETRRCNGRLAAFVNERVTYAAVMQSLGRVGHERRVLRRRSRRFSTAMVRQTQLTGALGAVAEACRIGACVAVIGAAMIVHTRTDVLASLLPVAGFLGGPLASLADTQYYWQRSRIARRRITEVTSAPRLLAAHGAPPLTEGPGRLELVDVRVDGVIKDVSALVTPGRRVALTGPPGAGKSLLLSLIARLRVPDDGAVLLDGQNLAEHDPESVWRAIRLVSPDLSLLRGSVAMNLRHGAVPGEDDGDQLGEPWAEHDEPLAQLLPEGLRTRVGEGGYGLSRAARYQVAIARALRSHPRVLLLDQAEPEGTLGDSTFDALFSRYPGTIVYVTRDTRLLARADLVWRLTDGSLRSEDTPGPRTSTAPRGVTSRMKGRQVMRP